MIITIRVSDLDGALIKRYAIGKGRKTDEYKSACENANKSIEKLCASEYFSRVSEYCEIYTIEALKTMVWRYFMSYWSNRRICSAIGGITPAVKRRRFFSALTIAA